MKTLKKIFCLSAFFLMSFSAFSINAVKNVKTNADASYEDIYGSRFEIESSGRCYLKLLGSDAVTSATANAVLSGTAWKSDALINFKDKLIFNVNGVQKTLSELVVASEPWSWNKFTRASCISFVIDPTYAAAIVNSRVGGKFSGTTIMIRQNAVLPSVSYSANDASVSYMRFKAGCLWDYSRDYGVSLQFNETDLVDHFDGMVRKTDREDAYKYIALQYKLPASMNDGTNFGSDRSLHNKNAQGVVAGAMLGGFVKYGGQTLFDILKAEKGRYPQDDEMKLITNPWANWGYNEVSFTPLEAEYKDVTFLKNMLIQRYDSQITLYADQNDTAATIAASKVFNVGILTKDITYFASKDHYVNYDNATIVENTITSFTGELRANNDGVKTCNTTFYFEDADYASSADMSHNLFANQTLTSKMHFYDLDENELDIAFDTQTVFAWGTKRLLVQYNVPGLGELAFKAYKLVIDGDFYVPSMAFATTGTGNVYHFTSSYTFIRFNNGSGTWKNITSYTESGARQETLVTQAGFGPNKDTVHSYNITFKFSNFNREGSQTGACYSVMKALATHIHFYDASGVEITNRYFNSQQYLLFNSNIDLLLQVCFPDDTENNLLDHVVLEDGALIPSISYQQGSGNLFVINNRVVAKKNVGIISLDQVETKMSLSYTYTYSGDPVVYTDVDFRLNLAISSNIASIASTYYASADYGIEVSTGTQTRRYASAKLHEDSVNNLYTFVLGLGDLLNNTSRFDDSFTVKPYVLEDGVYHYSSQTKTYSVRGMVNEYHDQGIHEVDGLWNILQNI